MATVKGRSRNKSSSVIPEIDRKLHAIGQSLPPDMQPALGFLCLAVCPKSCIYPRNIRQPQSVKGCYTGLCDYSLTQQIAMSLLLHFLPLVECSQRFIDELRCVAQELQLAADEKDIYHLPSDSKKKLNFHTFLLSIYCELPDDSRKEVISLTSGLLKPRRHPSYTPCLIVHFIVMMEGTVIMPDDLRPLQHCLEVLGQYALCDKIKGYLQQSGVSFQERARPRIERVSLHFTSSEPDTRNMETSENRCMWSKSIPGLQEKPHSVQNIVHHEGEGASEVSPCVLSSPQQEWDRDGTHATVTPQAVLSKPVKSRIEGQEENGVEFQLRHYDLAVDRHENGIMTSSTTPQKGSAVKIKQTRRLSKNKGYLNWALSGPTNIQQYSVTIQPLGETAKSKIFTESVEFVATKLEEKKQYSVTVCGLAEDGSVVGEDHTSIPLLTRSEDLPVPSEVQFECGADIRHLKILWNKLTSEDVVGYVIRYYNPEAEEQRKYVEVEGAEETQCLLERISEHGLYVDVAAKMKEDLVGPYSQGIDVPPVPRVAQRTLTDGNEEHPQVPLTGQDVLSGAETESEERRSDNDTTSSPVEQRTLRETEERIRHGTPPVPLTGQDVLSGAETESEERRSDNDTTSSPVEQRTLIETEERIRHGTPPVPLTGQDVLSGAETESEERRSDNDTTSSPVEQRTPRETEERIRHGTPPGRGEKTTKWLTCPCSLLIILIIATVASAGLFAYFVHPTGQHKSHYIEQEDTIDLGTYDYSRYSMADVTSTLNDSTITVYSRNMACHNIPVYPNTTYHINGSLNFTPSVTNRMGIFEANGYFAHSSMPTFQLNATGLELLNKSNCSAAFVLFDSQTEYATFLSYGNNTATSIKQICFDVFNDTTEFLNTSVSVPVRSTYIYTALFAQNVDRLSYLIAGDRNYYNNSDFLNSTKCVIMNTSSCSFPLPSKIFSSFSDTDVCILAHWAQEPLSSIEAQLLTTKTSYVITSSFPHNFLQFLLLVLSLILLVFLLISCGFALCCCYYKCHFHSRTVNLRHD